MNMQVTEPGQAGCRSIQAILPAQGYCRRCRFTRRLPIVAHARTQWAFRGNINYQQDQGPEQHKQSSQNILENPHWIAPGTLESRERQLRSSAW